MVNADSMQVYAVLRVLTARPSDDDLAAAPHALYGHVPPARAYSTGEWMRDVAELAASGAFAERRPIFVGGTGLYFRALLEGLSQMPIIPQAVREHWRSRLAEEGAAVLHRVLSARDPEAGRTIRPSDGQRIVRALEVLQASGRPIGQWQAQKGRPLVDATSVRRFVLEPPREIVVERIDRRFERMVEEGALDEARAMIALDLDLSLPAAKAIGLRELQAHLDGKLSLEEAIERGKIATRQYSKRQATWFRHQLGAGWRRLTDGRAVDRALEEVD